MYSPMELAGAGAIYRGEISSLQGLKENYVHVVVFRTCGSLSESVQSSPTCRSCLLIDHISVPIEKTVPRVQRIITSKVLGYLCQEIIKHYTYGSGASQRRQYEGVRPLAPSTPPGSRRPRNVSFSSTLREYNHLHAYPSCDLR